MSTKDKCPTENPVWEVEHEVGTHLKDIEALGALIMAAAYDENELLTPDSLFRIGCMFERLAQKAEHVYSMEQTAKLQAVQLGGAS